MIKIRCIHGPSYSWKYEKMKQMNEKTLNIKQQNCAKRRQVVWVYNFTQDQHSRLHIGATLFSDFEVVKSENKFPLFGHNSISRIPWSTQPERWCCSWKMHSIRNVFNWNIHAHVMFNANEKPNEQNNKNRRCTRKIANRCSSSSNKSKGNIGSQ